MQAGPDLVFLALLLIILGYCHEGWCIQCVQCTTLRDKGCESGTLPATDCSPENKFCLKYVGKVNTGSIVFRGCNKKAIEPLCTVKQIEQQDVRVCYETCNTTACNGGPVLSTAPAPRSSTPCTCSLLMAIVTVLFATMLNKTS